jgi:hypothetical protein
MPDDFPPKGPNETTTIYWMRRTQYEAWADGFAAGLDEDGRVANGYEPATNPYQEPST